MDGRVVGGPSGGESGKGIYCGCRGGFAAVVLNHGAVLARVSW